ncbi:MAG: TetR/AcrR family transcriptional regulator [Novosphingobium sp.]
MMTSEKHSERTSGLLQLRPRQIEILDQLETYFFAHGYRSATMEVLAQNLKCSKRALYELAPNRKELFTLIVDRWAKRIRWLGAEAEARHSDPRRRLAAYLQPGVSESRGVTRTFLIDLRDLPQARATLEQHQRERMTHLKGILDEGAKQGVFKDVHAHLVAGICLAGIEKINEPTFLAQAGLSFSQAFAELYRLLMTGLEGK